jgi:hypothetical protein
MSLAEIYADGIEGNLQRWAANPGPDAEPTFRGSAVLGAIPSAALEASASLQELIAGAESRSLATLERQSLYAESRGREGIPAERLERKRENVRKLQEAASAARRRAVDSSPDPLTTHAADQVIHGVGRFAAKAVTAVGTMGPVGSVLLGLEEGNTVAQGLMLDGVDPQTAGKVGAVQGGLAAAGVVLPIAGQTVAQTIGLVGAGGPGTFMAQEALSRKILEEAGYRDQASLHNPFDPLGLGLSTLLPGAFGALHLRTQRRPALEKIVEHIESGGQRYGKDGQLLTSPKGAQGEMQVMPGTARDPGFGVAPARDDSPEELARVGRDYLAAMQQRYAGDTDKALAAYNAGPGAVDKAMAEHGADWLKHMPKETREYVHRANALGARHAAEVAAQDPATVDAARVAVLNDVTARSLPETPDSVVQMQRAADIVAESGGRAAEVEIPPVRNTSQYTVQAIESGGFDIPVARVAREGDGAASPWLMPDGRIVGTGGDHMSIIDGSYSDYMRRTGAVRAAFFKDQTEGYGITLHTAEGQRLTPEQVSAIEEIVAAQPRATIARGEANGMTNPEYRRVGLEDVRREAGLPAQGAQISTGAPRPSARPTDNALPPPDSVTLTEAAPVKPGATAKPAAKGEGAEAGPASETQPPSSPAAAMQSEMAERLAAESPDLQVVLPGAEERVTVKEALARIAEERKQDEQWADLVKVAAECALMNG